MDFSKVAKEVEAASRAAMLKAFEQLFEALPELEAVRWVQYTPYFNDGEPCEFQMHGFEIRLKDSDEFYDYIYAEMPPHAAKAYNTVVLLEKIPAGCFLACFGDHTQVTVLRDLTVTTEQQDHE